MSGQGEQVRAGAGCKVTRPTYRLIQVLRALAAMMVVAHHATIMIAERDHLVFPNWIAGSSGVDLFFVISGFVMTISSTSLREVRHPARTFLARRVERIVPLYWLVTTAKVLLLLIFPALALNGLGSLWHIISSYLFITSVSAEGRLEPVVVVGWTLNFEMAFYLAFAAVLAFRGRPARVLVPILFLIPLLPLQWLQQLPVFLGVLTSPMLWEFAMGMLLGGAAHQVRRMPQWTAWMLLPPAFWLLATWNVAGVSPWRGVHWGIPAAAVIFSAVVLENRWGARSPRWLLEFGDSSYSLYLVHTLALPLVGFWVVHWTWKGPLEIPVILVLSLLVSVLAGEALYRLVERPLMLHFQGRRRSAIPANV